MGRRWIVIDPGFEHKDSHHMIVNNQITSAGESDEVIIVAGINLDASPLNLNAQIIPFFDINSPILQVNSVGNGPDPTRVVYALTIPMTSSRYNGPRPVPVIELPAVVFEEVTKGYVP